MKYSLFLVLAISFFAIISGCDKPGLVDGELQLYLDRFKEEAELRNITIDYKSKPVEARFVNQPDEVSLGWCNYSPTQHNTVYINLVFWQAMQSDFMKEQLVFHELGHCILNRPHLDLKRPDGYCKSIMHSGQSCADNYSERTRDQYLDELFLSR